MPWKVLCQNRMSKIILNVGVVGTGVGREHINAYRLQPEKFRVKAICSFDSEMGTKLASYDSDCYFTDNILKLLADKSIHIIDICVPPIGHFELIRRVLSSNKHVICEEPLVSSLAQFDELESDLRISKYRIFPVFQYRFGDGFRSLIRCHEIGILGSPLIASLETHWSRGTEYYSVPWRGTWQGELGGALLGHAIHIHDMATLILGEVSSVAGRFRISRQRGRTADRSPLGAGALRWVLHRPSRVGFCADVYLGQVSGAPAPCSAFCCLSGELLCGHVVGPRRGGASFYCAPRYLPPRL